MTLPGGKRTGFTFKPVMDPEIIKALRMGAPLPQSMIFYNPAFETDDGEQVTLSVQKTQLLYNQETGQYYHPSGSPYNPANSFFGGSYTLTTKEGIKYVIDGTTGDLLTVTDTNGNTLTYSDEGIFSSTGKSVTFERNAEGRIVAAVDPEGERIEYEYDENGDLVGVTDREENTTKFEYHEEREHYLEEIIDPLGRTGVRTEYDESGRLKRMLNVNGEAVELVYDPDNSTQTVLDVFGNPTTYVYDSRGNVLTEVDSKGGINQYTYDENNNLLSETDRDGIVTQYTYDNNGNITSISDADGNITRMSYNQYGQVLSIVSPTGLTVSSKYDSRGNLLESTDTDGLTTTYVYDNTGKLIRQVAPDGQTMEWGYDTFGNPTRMVDSQGNEVNATYDRNGRMQNASMDFSVDGETHTLSRNFTYDKEGRTLSSINSQGSTQSQTYNELGKVASTTDILGNVTLYDYNDKGLLTRVTLPDYTPDNPNDNPQILKEYDAAGRLVKETSPLGLVIEYVYDELGRSSETILPDLTPDNPSDNPRIQTEYTPAGRIARQRDILGNWTSFDYDHFGRLIKETDVFGNHTTTTYNLGGQIASITDGRNRTTNLVYDEKSRLKEAVSFDQTKFSLTYDSLGRVASETNPLGQTTRYEYDDFGRVNVVIDPLNQRTEVEYDNRGNLVKLTDALGQITRYEYDEYGRQTATIFANGDRVEMGYDNFNRQITAKDENGNITQYEYDNFNRTTAIGLANNARTRYSYDNLGQLIKIEDALNRSTQFEYDDFGRMVGTILPMGQRSESVFDNLGFLGSYTDFNGDTIHYDYDNFGRLQQKTFSNPDIAAVGYTYDPVTSQIRTVSDGRGVTSYEYDNRDRLSQITNPDGKAIAYGYDVLNNVTSLTTETLTTEYAYDALNRLDLVKDGNEILADYDYDAIGNLVQTTRADGTVETRSYDNRSRLTDIETLNSVGQAISGFSYTLDGVGNRTQVVEHDGRTVNYAYDSLNRLLQEKISPENRTTDYTYDLVGNRLSRNDSVLGLTTYDYDANDRLTQMLSAGVTTQFTYDDNGSMLSRSSGGETVTYDWINDGENRLVGVNSTDASGNQSVNYVYDAQGNRVASIGDGVRTNYLVTPGGLSQVLAEYDSNGLVTRDYTYGLGLVRSVEGGSDSFYHTDGLGSVRMLTDTTGRVSDRNSYDAYGISLSNSDGSYQFAGERRDAETGLDYLRARYYDPELGRFISKDAFAGFLNDPMSQHDYQYAHANPVNNTDPTGYFTLPEVVTGISFGAILVSVGSSLGYVGGQYANGGSISGGEALVMFDQWVAGYAHGVSGGITTAIRREDYGEIQEGDHAFLWNMGNLAGISTSFILGFQLPAALAGQMGATKWGTTFASGIAAAAEGYGIYEAGMGLADGQWDRSDVFNLLSLVPYAVPAVAGVANSLGTMRAANRAAGGVTDDVGRAAGSVDDMLRSSQRTEVAIETGARWKDELPWASSTNLNDMDRWINYAPEAYDVIRDSSTDVTNIARHTGWPEYRIRRIREHLFEKIHQLDSGLGQFDPDPDVADAWGRLQRNEFTPEDLHLLEHEYFESKFEGIFKTNYRTAHDKTIRSGRIWKP